MKEMETYKIHYTLELKMIEANGNDRDALRNRAEQYHTKETHFLESIKRTTLELAGMRSAYLDKLREITEREENEL